MIVIKLSVEETWRADPIDVNLVFTCYNITCVVIVKNHYSNEGQ